MEFTINLYISMLQRKLLGIHVCVKFLLVHKMFIGINGSDIFCLNFMVHVYIGILFNKYISKV